MKTNIFKFGWMIVGMISLLSCGNNSNSKVQDLSGATVTSYDTTLKSGVISEKVVCKSDASVSYALYLPTSYNAGTFFPVIYIFDPHASGLLPVSKYKDLAEKYGYIMIGSNNSKNGVAWDAINQTIKTMMDDSQNRLSIDKNRIYTAGFSGGSRVASSVAIYDGGIRGVIGCSAGFPQLNKKLDSRFDFIGIAGNEDFNMTEMKNLDKSLETSGLRHQFIIFNGIHEWCPVETFNQAFQWIQINEMQDKMIPVNNTMIDEIKNSYQKKIKESEASGKKYEAVILYKQLISFLGGLIDVSTYKKSMDSLSNSSEVKNIMQQKEETEKKESAMQQEYAGEITTKDLSWWTNEVRQLNSISKQGNEEKYLMNKRLLGFLSLVAYSQSNNALNSNQLDKAENFIKLYAIIDPPNNEHSYMMATLYAKRNEVDKVFIALNEAVKLGFDDINRLNNDPVLSMFKSNNSYDDVVNAIKAKLVKK
jgi:predicted esterase